MPTDLFENLKAKSTGVQIKVRSCSHNDLHPKNVAIDVKPKPKRGYILDAAAMFETVAVRDLAYLEATAILFQSSVNGPSFVDQCRVLFGNEYFPVDVAQVDHPLENLRLLSIEIRRHAASWDQPAVYALMLFESTLIELQGLSFQTSGNWINEPANAAILASVVAGWIKRVFPELLE